jgi:DNA invertase Pin-like site-specific DNA recombinase
MSPELQRAEIQRYAEAHNIEILEWHTDLDQSGGKLSRPAFDRMMARVEARQTGGVVCAKLDRFARNILATVEIKRIHDAGGSFVAVQEAFDATTPMGKAMLNVVLTFAELELDRHREGWRATTEAVVKRGIHPHLAPFGFEKADDKRLIPHPVEAEVVRQIFHERGRGATWSEIARDLNNASVKPRKGRAWAPRVLKDITRNRVYLGIAYAGPFENPNAHTPLVTRKDFEAAKHATPLNPPVSSGEGYLLAGLCRCAGCSYRMAGDHYSRKSKRTRAVIARIAQYRCKLHHGQGRCPTGGSIDAANIERYVVGEFFKFIGNICFVPAEKTAEVAPAIEAYEAAQHSYRTFRDDIEAQRLLGHDEWLEALSARKAGRDLAKRALAEARARAAGADLPDPFDLMKTWDALGVQEQRIYLSAAIDAVMVRKQPLGASVSDRIQILWRGQAPSDFPDRGYTRPMREYVFAPDLAPVDVGVAQSQVVQNP